MRRTILFLTLYVLTGSLSAQVTNTTYRQKIALFAPLYLDSAFSGTDYRFSNSFPRYIIPGLEFYEGFQLALDSLNAEGVPLEVYVYDTKSATKPFKSQLQELPEVQLIIGSAGVDEIRALAGIAQERKIPFISASFPNDGGVTNNPYFVILNSTLATHIRMLYQFVKKNHSLNHVVYFRRKSSQDDWLKNIFTETAQSSTGSPLKVNYVELDYGFTPETITQYLDSNTTNIGIAGSMDETFNKQIAAALSSVGKTYKSRLMGMPTWESYKDLNKPDYRDVEIVYTAALYNPRTDKLSQSITDLYKNRYYSRPSEMVFWGYFNAWKYGKLLLEYGNDVSSNLSVNRFDVFTATDIQPVINKQTDTLDYFENQKIYFISRLNGIISALK